MELQLKGLQGSYVELVRHVADHGHVVDVRGQRTYEVTGATLVFDDVRTTLLPVGVGRGINLRLAAVEALQLIAGASTPDLVQRAAPEFTRVLVDASDLDYAAYGPRLLTQLADVAELLTRDPTSRQAVAQIWKPEDLTHAGDRPCTIFMQFLIRNEALELHVHMRSNDVWLGVPYDVFAFTQLQHTVARALRRSAGRYVHHATSLHLYDRDVERASNLRHQLDAAPVDVLPRGIEVPWPDEETFDWRRLRGTAALLLDFPEITEHDNNVKSLRLRQTRERNPWYARQLARIPAEVP